MRSQATKLILSGLCAWLLGNGPSPVGGQVPADQKFPERSDFPIQIVGCRSR